jgi:hypothetical protein
MAALYGSFRPILEITLGQNINIINGGFGGSKRTSEWHILGMKWSLADVSVCRCPSSAIADSGEESIELPQLRV